MRKLLFGLLLILSVSMFACSGKDCKKACAKCAAGHSRDVCEFTCGFDGTAKCGK